MVEFELYALRRCAHAHAVELLGAADVGGDTYIAMEWCEAGDCMPRRAARAGGRADDAPGARAPPRGARYRCRAILLLRALARSQLASALAHAHKQGVVHLDVSPANVLLAADGSIR